MVGHVFHGSLLVFTDAAWALNFRGGRTVTVLGRGRQLQGEALLVEDAAETAAALRGVLGQVPSPRCLGLHIDPGDDELAAVRRMVRLPS